MTSKSAVIVGSEDEAFLDGLLSKNSLITCGEGREGSKQKSRYQETGSLSNLSKLPVKTFLLSARENF